jgi:hypothetical protein
LERELLDLLRCQLAVSRTDGTASDCCLDCRKSTDLNRFCQAAEAVAARRQGPPRAPTDHAPARKHEANLCLGSGTDRLAPEGIRPIRDLSPHGWVVVRANFANGRRPCADVHRRHSPPFAHPGIRSKRMA